MDARALSETWPNCWSLRGDKKKSADRICCSRMGIMFFFKYICFTFISTYVQNLNKVNLLVSCLDRPFDVRFFGLWNLDLKLQAAQSCFAAYFFCKTALKKPGSPAWWLVKLSGCVAFVPPLKSHLLRKATVAQHEPNGTLKAVMFGKAFGANLSPGFA